VCRHLALSLLCQEKTARGSLKGKRRKAGWDDASLTKGLRDNSETFALPAQEIPLVKAGKSVIYPSDFPVNSRLLL
jgi:hypothetical protein